MAYTEPVVALVVDPQMAAAAIGEPADYFDDDRNYDRWDGVVRLGKLTGAPVESFASEDESVYYIGVQVEADFFIEIGPALLQKAAVLKNQHRHPLIQSAKLAVVSQFG